MADKPVGEAVEAARKRYTAAEAKAQVAAKVMIVCKKAQKKAHKKLRKAANAVAAAEMMNVSTVALSLKSGTDLGLANLAGHSIDIDDPKVVAAALGAGILHGVGAEGRARKEAIP